MINRDGEKISAEEVENVVLREGASLTRGDVGEERRIARFELPERLVRRRATA